jgi:hypothetical protein
VDSKRQQLTAVKRNFSFNLDNSDFDDIHKSVSTLQLDVDVDVEGNDVGIESSLEFADESISIEDSLTSLPHVVNENDFIESHSSSSDENSLTFLQDYGIDTSLIDIIRQSTMDGEEMRSQDGDDSSPNDEESYSSRSRSTADEDLDTSQDSELDQVEEEVLQIYANMDQALMQFNSMDFDDDLGVDKMRTGRVVDRQTSSSYSRDMTRIDEASEASEDGSINTKHTYDDI